VDNGHVIVATEGNTVYSLNAGDGTVAWSQNPRAPVVPHRISLRRHRPPSASRSTPVIDSTTGTLRGRLPCPAAPELFASTWARAQFVASHGRCSGADPQVHNQRGALALSQATSTYPSGPGPGDCGQYQGRVVASPVNGTGALLTYSVPTAREAGIWGPAGPTVDAATGDVLSSPTGNSDSTTTFDSTGRAVIRLSSSLSVLDYWLRATGRP